MCVQRFWMDRRHQWHLSCSAYVFEKPAHFPAGSKHVSGLCLQYGCRQKFVFIPQMPPVLQLESSVPTCCRGAGVSFPSSWLKHNDVCKLAFVMFEKPKTKTACADKTVFKPIQHVMQFCRNISASGLGGVWMCRAWRPLHLLLFSVRCWFGLVHRLLALRYSEQLICFARNQPSRFSQKAI